MIGLVRGDSEWPKRRYSSSAKDRYIPIGMVPEYGVGAEMTERVLEQLAQCKQKHLCGEGRRSYCEQAVRSRISKLASNESMSFLLSRHAD